MFELAKKNLGADRPLVVGDRLDTDIAGGVAAGMDTLHVLTGVSGPHALIDAPAEQRPTFIAQDMSVLLDAELDPDTLRPSAQGGFTAVREGGAIVLDGGDDSSTPLQALRTVLSVAWADGGERGDVVKPASDAARAGTQAWW